MRWILRTESPLGLAAFGWIMAFITTGCNSGALGESPKGTDGRMGMVVVILDLEKLTCIGSQMIGSWEGDKLPSENQLHYHATWRVLKSPGDVREWWEVDVTVVPEKGAPNEARVLALGTTPEKVGRTEARLMLREGGAAVLLLPDVRKPRLAVQCVVVTMHRDGERGK